MREATASARTPEAARKVARLLERRTTVMKALAHPSRLLMVDALSAGERCVCDLQALVGADMSTVSKHLSLLRSAGIVLSAKRGQQVWYRLRVPCLLSFFSCVDAVFADPDADLVEVPLPAPGATDRTCAKGCATPRRGRG
jgi:DNA-binding transcriptional ArsR family regulator